MEGERLKQAGHAIPLSPVRHLCTSKNENYRMWHTTIHYHYKYALLFPHNK